MFVCFVVVVFVIAKQVDSLSLPPPTLSLDPQLPNFLGLEKKQ